MDAKKFVLGSLAGAVTLFLLGFVFYVVLLADFFMGQAGETAAAYRAEPLLWAIFIGEWALAGLVTLVFGKWAAITTFGSGMKTGALLGLLVGLSINFTLFGTTTLSAIGGTLVDPIVYLIRVGIAGGVIAWVLSRG